MQVSFEVPEDIARALAPGQTSLDRTALESLAIEGYRSGLLGESQVMRLLRARHVPYRYTEADLSDDLADLSELGLR